MAKITNQMAANRKKKNATAGKNGRDSFCILLPLERLGSSASSYFKFATLLARAVGGEILALHVRTPDMADTPVWPYDPPVDELPDDIPCDIHVIEANTVAEGILETARAEKVDLILLAWRVPSQALRTRLSQLVDPVIEDAPCDVLFLHGDPEEVRRSQPAYRFMVARAGGQNADAALEIALHMARHVEGEVTLVTVVPESPTAEALEEAEALLEQAMADVGVRPEERETRVFARVIRSDDVRGALSQASKNHSLALFGAPELSILSQLLTGTIVDEMMEAVAGPIVVVRRYNARQYWARRLWRGVDRLLPDVSIEDRLDAYKRMRRGARATHDFYVLMLLSTIIATMGLLLNSAAVIIGAMLVAPLMTPMLGIALGMVMGDGRLLQLAARSTGGGVVLSVAVAAALAAFVPLPPTTEEILSRTQPNLLDLTVGLAAGAAGAYAIARKSVAASLPGVAIAAALVPPLGVVGISLAAARWNEAYGAMLLFFTNLVAISFAGAFVYMLLGFFPQTAREQRQGRLRTGMLLVLLLLFGISVPLTRSSIDQVFDRSFNRTVSQLFQEQEGLSLLSMDWEDAPAGQPMRVRVVLLSSTTITPAVRQEIEDKVEAAADQPVDLRVLIVPLQELESEPVTQE